MPGKKAKFSLKAGVPGKIVSTLLRIRGVCCTKEEAYLTNGSKQEGAGADGCATCYPLDLGLECIAV